MATVVVVGDVGSIESTLPIHLLGCKEVSNDRQIKYSGAIVFADATVD
jgi:hypothetical protein